MWRYLERSGFWSMHTNTNTYTNTHMHSKGSEIIKPSQEQEYQHESSNKRNLIYMYVKVLSNLEAKELRGLLRYYVMQCRRAELLPRSVGVPSDTYEYQYQYQYESILTLLHESPILQAAFFVCMHHYIV